MNVEALAACLSRIMLTSCIEIAVRLTATEAGMKAAEAALARKPVSRPVVNVERKSGGQPATLDMETFLRLPWSS
jgi:hypothetical protein